jgi:tRNA pseudouridine55 synthase
MKPSSYHGLLVVDKPQGITSRAVVDRALRWFPRGTRVGHTGTLDPLATGVLVLCVGTATRLTEYVQDMVKVYRAGVLLGARSETDDAEGSISPVTTSHPPERVAVENVLAEFIGEHAQVPPTYSAAKVTGRRAYNLARAGEAVTLGARPVRIAAIEVLSYAYPRLEVEVNCGKGTYLRSLARDLGERLGCGGLIESLRRTRVGPYTADGALSPDVEATNARAALMPLAAAVAGLPRLTLAGHEVSRLSSGQAIPLASLDIPNVAEEVAVFDVTGVLVAVGKVDLVRRLLLPGKVLVGER